MIILHGLYGSSDNWISIAKTFSDTYTVYLVDQRNHGQSPHSDIHDYPSMRDDLLEFMDRMELPRAIIIGHSMGGKTAAHFAESYPERIAALIIIDIAPTPYRDDGHTGQSGVHKTILGGMMEVDFSKVKRREDVDEQLSATIESPKLRSFLMKNISHSSESGFGWKVNVGALHRNLEKIFGGIDPERYRGGDEIAGFPVLFIRGEKSGFISDDDIITIQQIFPDARVSTIPDAGHWLHVEQSSLLIRTIRYFL